MQSAPKRIMLVFIGAIALGARPAVAQDPPVPPPVVQPPPIQDPAPAPPAADALAPRAPLSEADLRRRRDAIFLLEGVLVKSVMLAASSTQREIESALSPGTRIAMFSALPPEARGNYLQDYGVFFQVLIPTYMPSVAGILETLQRNQPAAPRAQVDPAQPASLSSERGARSAMFSPDAVYVEAVRRFLIDAMLEHSKSLDLRPHEWLTVSARGEDSGPGQISEPSIMILRVKGSDLVEFLAGRLSRDEVRKRVQVQGFSGR